MEREKQKTAEKKQPNDGLERSFDHRREDDKLDKLSPRHFSKFVSFFKTITWVGAIRQPPKRRVTSEPFWTDRTSGLKIKIQLQDSESDSDESDDKKPQLLGSAPISPYKAPERKSRQEQLQDLVMPNTSVTIRVFSY